jgi:hypothetical protein
VLLCVLTALHLLHGHAKPRYPKWELGLSLSHKSLWRWRWVSFRLCEFFLRVYSPWTVCQMALWNLTLQTCCNREMNKTSDIKLQGWEKDKQNIVKHFLFSTSACLCSSPSFLFVPLVSVREQPTGRLWMHETSCWCKWKTIIHFTFVSCQMADEGAPVGL